MRRSVTLRRRLAYETNLNTYSPRDLQKTSIHSFLNKIVLIKIAVWFLIVGTTGFEPITDSVSGNCSTKLRYIPKCKPNCTPVELPSGLSAKASRIQVCLLYYNPLFDVWIAGFEPTPHVPKTRILPTRLYPEITF